jgi:hypothetical protein
MHNNPTKDTTALAKIHFDTIFMFVLLAKRMWALNKRRGNVTLEELTLAPLMKSSPNMLRL